MSEQGDTGVMEAILSTSLDTVKEPSLVPTGTWLVRGKGWSSKQVEGNDGPQVKFVFGFDPYQPQSNVDATDVEKAEFKGATLWYQMFIAPHEVYKVKQFAERLGIDTTGRDVKTALAAGFKGSMTLAEVGIGTQENKKTGEIKTVNTLSKFARPS